MSANSTPNATPEKGNTTNTYVLKLVLALGIQSEIK